MMLDFITPTKRQLLGAISAGLLMTGNTVSLGYPAAALPQIEQPDSSIHLTPQEASWFATVTLMMCIPGSVIGATAYEWVGPRRMMLALTPILAFSTMIMAIASWTPVKEAGMTVIVLLASRVIQGSAVALLNPIVSVYIYEVCDQRLRGTMNSLIATWSTIGHLLCYISGCFLSWETIALVLPVIILTPSFIGMLLSHESPLWLARKGREEEARIVLTQVRCTKEEVAADLKVSCDRLKDEEVLTCSESFRKVASRPNIMAMTASSCLVLMKELSGFAVLLIYVVHIFDEAGVGLDPRYSSVVVGSVRLVCSTIASFMLHNLSRRLMLIAGNILMGISTIVIGVFFYLQSIGEDIKWLSWLPLTGLVVYVIGYAGAVGPTTWTVAVEVLPGPVRSLGLGIGTMCYAIGGFVITKMFTQLLGYIGMYGVFWIFTGGSAGYIAMTLFVIPETHGRSLKDIEEYWEGKPRRGKPKPENV